jgi:hypothetical protein
MDLADAIHVLLVVVEGDVIVTECSQQYLAWNGTSILNGHSVLATGVDLDESIINYWVYHFDCRSFEGGSHLEADRGSILDLNIEEGRLVAESGADQRNLDLDFIVR